MGNSTIDILTIVLVLLLIILAYNSDSGFSLLIISEICWMVLYTLYLLYGILFLITTPCAVSIFILVLAGVDCGIWVLFLVFYDRMSRNVYYNVSGDLKFLFRSLRLLRSNRFIK